MTGAWDSSHAPSRLWRSGAWSLELRDDELAEIRFNARRVLRSIRAVVRDRDWATAALAVDRIRETDSTLTLHVRSDGLGSSFAGVVRVEARAHSLLVICDLESADAFETNRTGLVVLHPMRVAGQELAVTHASGGAEATRFPVAISPHQPVLDIAALAWHDDGLAIDASFGGDVFEMEDQRNWSDASFKTYSRPLALPFPFLVPAGERVRQQLSIRVRETAAATAAPPTAQIGLRRTGVFPQILVGASTGPDPAPAPLPIGDGVVVELDLGSTNWRAALERARSSGLPLDVRATLRAGERSASAIELADELRDTPLLRVAAFDPRLHVTDAAAAAALRSALAAAGVATPMIAGARSHFTEYNREHARIPGDVDGVVIATTPLFHSLGTEQLVESLAVQRLIAEQTVSMARAAPVHVGPISLRPRFNNVATGAAPAPTRDDLRDGYGAEFTGAADPRQSAPELAAWIIASAAALAVPGVASLSWFEEWGPRGIRSVDGALTPAAEALRALATLSGGDLLTGESLDGRIWAIGGVSGDEATLLVANLHESDRGVELIVEGRAVTATVPARAFVSVRL